jgi:solute:Na+ symporter, SSS family
MPKKDLLYSHSHFPTLPLSHSPTLIFVISFLCCLTISCSTPKGSARDKFIWQKLPQLPQARSGQFAGVSNGALVVIGGTNFPVSLFDGGQKLWYDDVFVLEPGQQEWRTGLRIDRPLAYGGSVTTSDGVICIGGSDSARHYADVFRLSFMDGHIEQTRLPNLPQSCAMMSATMMGHTIYVAGGQSAPSSTDALRSFWSLDLSDINAGWKQLDPWPGAGRILPVVVAQNGSIYIISGAELSVDDKGEMVRRYLNDGYAFKPGGGWKRIASAPRPLVGAAAISFGQSHLFVFGGDDGLNAQRVWELKDDHPGFSREVLGYHTITDTWMKIGSFPDGLLTTTATIWQNSVVIPGGEDRPGHRSSGVLRGEFTDEKRPFGFLNYFILICYLVVNLGIGAALAKRQKNTNDFFRGGQRIPWWAAGIAIFGTQLSSLTFMAVPAKTYDTDWAYIFQNAAIILLAPLVIFCYLPFFRRLDVTSAYEYLEKRFNPAMRLYGSAAFVLMQSGRMAIVLYLPALALSVVSDLNVYLCILTMGLLATLYTLLGGAEAVTWTEVLQNIILLGSAILSIVLIVAGLDGGPSQLFATALAEGKVGTFDWSWDYTAATVWVVLLGSLFSNLIPYTTDQAVIQRYLTTPSEGQAARAIWTNALLTIPATLLFFSIGTALYVYYKQKPQLLNAQLPTDAVFPWFIVSDLPIGLSGLVIAGLFAAGQSGAQSSMATALVTDFYRRFRPAANDDQCLKIARWLTLLLGMIAVGTASLMATFPIRSQWDLFLQLLGLLGGGLAGVFALGIFTTRAHGAGALVGVIASALTLAVVQRYTRAHFFLYAATGIITCYVVGYLASCLLPFAGGPLNGLTIHTTKKDLEQREVSNSKTSVGS